MAPPGYTIKVPGGNPGDLQIVVSNLRKLAKDLDGHGRILNGEMAGMTHWKSNGASAAATEAGTLGSTATTCGAHLGAGASALADFATVLETAQTKIKALDNQSNDFPAEARTEAAKNKIYPHLPPQDRDDWVNGIVADKMRPIMSAVNTHESDLSTAAKTCSGKLTAIVPGYKPGMSAGDVYKATYNDVALQLPHLAAKQGHDLAVQAEQYVDHGKSIPDGLLTMIEKDKGNAYFAKGFMEDFGTKDRLAFLVDVMQSKGNADDSQLKQNTRLLGDIGDMLAVGTNEKSPVRLSDSYLQKNILGPLDGKDGQKQEWAWALSQYIGASTAQYGRGFLDTIATKYLDLEKNDKRGFYLSAMLHHPNVITLKGAGQDPFVSIFHAMGKNADAAQDFFKDKSHLDYFLNDRKFASTYDVGDGGDTLGQALDAATTVYRNHGENGRISAQITADMFHDIGSHNDNNWLIDRHLGAMLPHLAHVVNSYRDDIFGALNTLGKDPNSGSGNVSGSIPELLGQAGQPWGVDFKANDVLRMLGEIDNDQTSYQSVINGQVDASGQFLAAKLHWINSQHPPLSEAEKNEQIGNIGHQYGRVMRELLGVNAQVQTGNAKNADDQANTILGFEKGIVGLVASSNPYTGAAWSVGGDFISSKLTSNELEQATQSANNLAHSEEFAGRLIQINEMQNGGGFSGTHADARVWATQHHVPANQQFFDQNGHLKDVNSMSTQQRNQYVAWVSDADQTGVGTGMEKLYEGFDAGYGDDNSYTGAG